MNQSSLMDEWLKAKAAEKFAQEKRREIEDKLVSILGDDYKDDHIKITPKYTRKIDGDVLDQIVTEEKLEHAASMLFRWKPELNLNAWKNTAPNITEKFAEAITTKPARPTFSIKEN